MIESSKLHALADNELPDEQRAQLMAQLNADPSAQAEYMQILSLKNALRSSASTPECDDLWKACRGRLDEIDKTKRVEAFVGKYAWGICGVFFVAIAFGGVFNRSANRAVPANDVAGYMAGLSLSSPRTQSKAELAPALKQIVGEAFIDRPAEMMVTAIGSNPEQGKRTQFARLTDAFGSVSVIALLDVKEISGLWDYEPNTKYKCAKVNGANAMFWNREDGVICMVIGQRSYDELYGIVKAMCSDAKK